MARNLFFLSLFLCCALPAAAQTPQQSFSAPALAPSVFRNRSIRRLPRRV